jgi:hypothetical protein
MVQSEPDMRRHPLYTLAKHVLRHGGFRSSGRRAHVAEQLGQVFEDLIGEYQRGWLPSDPSFLFRPEFLQHLLDFIDGAGQQPCPRCEEIVEDLQRQIEGLQVWSRYLRGGRA